MPQTELSRVAPQSLRPGGDPRPPVPFTGYVSQWALHVAGSGVEAVRGGGEGGSSCAPPSSSPSEVSDEQM